MRKAIILITSVFLVLGSVFYINEAHAANKIVTKAAKEATKKTMVFITERKVKETLKKEATKEVTGEVAQRVIKKETYLLVRNGSNGKLYNIKDINKMTQAEQDRLNRIINQKIDKKLEEAILEGREWTLFENVLDILFDYKFIIGGLALVAGQLSGEALLDLEQLTWEVMLESGLAFPAIEIGEQINFEGYDFINDPLNYANYHVNVNPEPWYGMVHEYIHRMDQGLVLQGNYIALEFNRSFINPNFLNSMELSLQHPTNFMFQEYFDIFWDPFEKYFRINVQAGWNPLIEKQLIGMYYNGYRLDTDENIYNTHFQYYYDPTSDIEHIKLEPVLAENYGYDTMLNNLKYIRLYYPDKPHGIGYMVLSDGSNEMRLYFETRSSVNVTTGKIYVMLHNESQEYRPNLDIKVFPEIKVGDEIIPEFGDIEIHKTEFEIGDTLYLPNPTITTITDPLTNKEYEFEVTGEEIILIDKETGEPVPEEEEEKIVFEVQIPENVPTPDEIETEIPVKPAPSPNPNPNPDPGDTEPESPPKEDSCPVFEIDTPEVLDDFTHKFPFSIPWDIFRAFEALFGHMGTEEPEWNLPIKWGDKEHTINIKLPGFINDWKPFIHSIVLFTFDISIIYALYRWFGGAG